MSKGRRRFLRLPGRDDVHRQVEDEVRFHLERKVEKLRASGMSDEEARAEAERRFGNVDAVKHAMEREAERREGRMKTRELLDHLRQDIGYALRRLGRSPGFTAITALTLTLGIGATTAIFSVVDGILLRPLPFERSEQLVAVWSDWSRKGGPQDEWPNFPNLWELREQSRGLQALGIWNGGNLTLTGLGDAQVVPIAVISHDMFPRVLRVEPELGRGFTPEEDRPGAPGTVIVSRGFFERVLGGDLAALGSTLRFNDQPFTLIGVMPAYFRPPFAPDAEVWVPLRMDGTTFSCGRGGACLLAVARLADGATLESAQAEASRIGERQAQDFPDANAGVGWTLRSLRDDLVDDTRTALLTLLGASALVLLIACVNQANLLLARGTARRGELAVRAAIGAGRGRIVAQLLTESLVLALVGGVVAVGAAYLLTDALVALAPAGTPRVEEVAVNGRVLAFAAGLTLVSGILFGVLPALRAGRAAPQDALREAGRGDARAGGGRVRSILVTTQVATALILLVGSGLLIRSFRNLRNVDLGFTPEGVTSFAVTLPATRYPDRAAILAFESALEERLSGLPGVQVVGASSSPPLAAFDSDTGFLIEGRPVPPPEQLQTTWYRQVTPGLLEALQVSVLSGRGIERTDDRGAPQVVVINEAFTARYFPGQDPIGRRIGLGTPEDPNWWEIVGVANDVKHFSIRGGDRVAMYVPFAQLTSRSMYFLVRSDRDQAALVAEIRSTLAEADPNLAAAGIGPLTEVVREALGPERFVTMLLTLFGGIAMALAAVGLYGVVSYDVNSRLREMGVRLALGASGGDVGALVLRKSLKVVGTGLVLGVAGALGLTRLMRSLLFGISTTDPWTFVFVAVALSAAAVLAAALPARRAARLDPVAVLRAD